MSNYVHIISNYVHIIVIISTSFEILSVDDSKPP